MAEGWAVLATVPHAENAVARELSDRNVPCRLIQRRAVKVRRNGRASEVLIPAFPRYILVDRNSTNAAADIEDAIDFLRCGEDIGLVTEAEMVDLEQRIDALDILLPVPEPCRFRLGERVIVHGSSLAAGHAGTFQKPLPDGLCVIEQEWLGRMVPVTVLIDDLDKSPKKRNFRRRRKRR